MAQLYPEIGPYEHGMLDVGNGNAVYWEVCGNPAGKPAVVLHGGPGSGCSPSMRRFFDPAAYRIVLFDQRGAGRSTPSVSDAVTSLESNTTHHLIRDIELLRRHLSIERWLIWGISWGATLALAYAERHPQSVSEIVLGSVTMTRRSDTEWLTRGVGMMFPDAWERFRDGVPERERDGDLSAAYAHLLASTDAAVREKAARDWCDWENAMVPHPRYQDSHFRMGFARTVTHYFSHAAWLAEGILLREAGKLAGIQGVMVHGRLDVGSPLSTPWQLSKAWPDSELVVVENSGHNISTAGMTENLVAATDRFASRA